jgi:hypothetical protein
MCMSEPSARTPADDANPGEEHDYLSGIHDDHQAQVAASLLRQPTTLLHEYNLQQLPPSMIGHLNAGYPQAAMVINTTHPPRQCFPTERALDTLRADILLAQHTQAASSQQRENHLKESLIYEQLGRATATGPLYGTATGGNLHDPTSRQRAVLPHLLYGAGTGGNFLDLYPPSRQVAPRLQPWLSRPSAASHMPPRPLAAPSQHLYAHGTADTASTQSFPLRQHAEISSFLQHRVAARALGGETVRASSREANNSREKRRQRNRIVDPFPLKLLRLLEDMDSKGTQGIACFTASGNAFRVHKPLEFIRDIAPQYFRQKHYSSFTRQLNSYGFDKLRKGPDKGAFAHPEFQREKPELAKSIVARIPEDYRSARVV